MVAFFLDRLKWTVLAEVASVNPLLVILAFNQSKKSVIIEYVITQHDFSFCLTASLHQCCNKCKYSFQALKAWNRYKRERSNLRKLRKNLQWCWAHTENMKLVPSSGSCATNAARGKTRALSCVITEARSKTHFGKQWDRERTFVIIVSFGEGGKSGLKVN